MLTLSFREGREVNGVQRWSQNRGASRGVHRDKLIHKQLPQLIKLPDEPVYPSRPANSLWSEQRPRAMRAMKAGCGLKPSPIIKRSPRRLSLLIQHEKENFLFLPANQVRYRLSAGSDPIYGL